MCIVGSRKTGLSCIAATCLQAKIDDADQENGAAGFRQYARDESSLLLLNPEVFQYESEKHR
jgi:hypothetical protein